VNAYESDYSKINESGNIYESAKKSPLVSPLAGDDKLGSHSFRSFPYSQFFFLALFEDCVSFPTIFKIVVSRLNLFRLKGRGFKCLW